MKKTFLILIFLLFAFLTSVGTELSHYADAPVGVGDAKKLIVISPGQGFGALSASLEEIGMVRSPLKFRLLARFEGYDKKIRAGEYQVSLSMSPRQILEMAASGKVYLRKLTIPEGYDISQIAEAVAKAGFAKQEDFVKAASDKDFMRRKGIEAETLEGYLFPDTYHFAKGSKPQAIVSAMTDRFEAVFRPEWKQRAADLGFSVHQTITLASIIEKETGLASERPLVASVFHNRLKRKMRLESDPTVIYGIENFDGNITRKDLERVTPYNTYKISGLPPGPIASPGAKSIEAALYPADTPFLFFVAKGDSSHQFSTTFAEHLQAVRKYQLGK
jgi:UPF0755 protein